MTNFEDYADLAAVRVTMFMTLGQHGSLLMSRMSRRQAERQIVSMVDN